MNPRESQQDEDGQSTGVDRCAGWNHRLRRP